MNRLILFESEIAVGLDYWLAGPADSADQANNFLPEGAFLAYHCYVINFKNTIPKKKINQATQR